ncbi:uncharacterized protein BXIN_1837 [Babesia sp. Xinjiang]|uniref:uncharacterized protein n=1 Tax=Babesia sp. Xinjiang TaxID=462227 RepID=UPI000A23CE14|nr:uncharacterized protein BXIN_1837 [Babesia sp. Xinjiang]ORM40281.1 hypothetical protein BXIN_1837 [Babesia sp. Xinjiang]
MVLATQHTLSGFRNKVEELRIRAQHVRQLREEIRQHRRRILYLNSELSHLRRKEVDVQHVADLITGVYIKCLEKMCKSLTYRVNQTDELHNYKECVKRLVDQWLADTLKGNIDNMEKTFARMRDIRNRIAELN